MHPYSDKRFVKENEYPKLILPDWFDKRMEDEAPMRGFLSHLQAELENGERYSLFFIDPIRLQQELEVSASTGKPYIAEQGMVVLPEVTMERIKEVLHYLAQDSFFENLKPL